MGRFGLEDLGYTISLRAAREYLAQHGWRVLEDGLRLVCEGPPDDEGRPIVQFLPPDESYADYPLRLEELISTLRVLEDRPAVEIAAEMARYDDLDEEFSRTGIRFAPGQDPKQAIDQLRALEASAELAIQRNRGDDLAAWEEIALLAVRFVRLVTVNRASSVLLWRRCDRILAQARLRFSSSPELLDELCKRASEATPANLDEVYLWLKAYTKPIDVAMEGQRPTSGNSTRVDSRSESGGLA
jgi:hypothetical protein